MQETLLPTLAVCGRPQNHDFDFLKEHEPFDHGFYAGPFGVCNVKPGT
jgi:isochorismate synthase EntC